jgi:hypothetical protein
MEPLDFSTIEGIQQVAPPTSNEPSISKTPETQFSHLNAIQVAVPTTTKSDANE